MYLISYLITDNLGKQQLTVDCVEMGSEACDGFLKGFASKTVFVNCVIFSLTILAQKKVRILITLKMRSCRAKERNIVKKPNHL